MTRAWRSRRVLGVGEAMVEFAPVGEGLYRRGFAGDTLNTCWHMAHLLGQRAEVGYFTRVGEDAFSHQLIAFLAESGVDGASISRDPKHSLGLYVISLDGAERSFSYWRENSAARRLADDPDTLAAAFSGAALIHVSGITLAVIGAHGRDTLFQALAEARAQGAVVSFDPNVRLALWPDLDTLRAATRAMLTTTDIALPSFDDEALVWGDREPEAALARIVTNGVAEIVVKNGPGEVFFQADGEQGQASTPSNVEIRDTTGAGDAFNAGYLSARFAGLSPRASIALGHSVATETLAVFGALAPPSSLERLRDGLARA
jgi:2-dehydro-3-deoxygluconokinase